MKLRDSRLTKNCILFFIFVAGTVMGGMARNLTQISYSWLSVLGLIIALSYIIKPEKKKSNPEYPYYESYGKETREDRYLEQ